VLDLTKAVTTPEISANVVILLGATLIWWGLFGGVNHRGGLLRRGVAMLERVEGWRLMLVGLTLAGVGLAWRLDARWLLFLSLGIGFVEIQEATHIIKAWRAGPATTRSRVPR
jgi:hypothetical protein